MGNKNGGKRKFKYSIDDMQKMAAEHNGMCLSNEYLGPHTKLKWQCELKHVWDAIPSSIKHSGRWCPHCNGNAKLTIEQMYKLAEERGGKCLSTEYVNNKDKLEWQCSENHIWFASASHIKSGTWCVCCSDTTLTIEEMHKLAAEKGGLCLSTKYINSYSKLTWQCSEKHDPWDAKPNSIKNGTWCPICSDTTLTIEEMHKLAAIKNGKCLSTEYINKDFKLIWQCSSDHIWNASPKSIKNGSWCPQCFIFINQEYCRKYLQYLFNTQFITCKPSWLTNPETNRQLQLDGYCAELNLAFEYNGEQHYKIVKFQPNISDEQAEINFINQQKRDKLKIELCVQNNVKLIVIPCWENKNIHEFILFELNRLNILIPK